MSYNSRYVAYARAHGRTPDEMLEADRNSWPGGIMAGYVIWIGKQWTEWSAQNPGHTGSMTPEDHEAFDRWLSERTESC